MIKKLGEKNTGPRIPLQQQHATTTFTEVEIFKYLQLKICFNVADNYN